MAKRKKKSFQSAFLALFLFVVALAAGAHFSGFDPETLAFEGVSAAQASLRPGEAGGQTSNSTPKPTPTQPRVAGGRLFVTVLDVGKADSIIITTPNDGAMLIDAGEKSAFPVVKEALERMGIERLDVVVATHPHADHIGGMKQVIDAYDVGEVYTPKVSSDTATYEGFVKAVAAKGIALKEAKAGVTIPFDLDVKVEVLAPLNYEYDNMNDCSAVLKLTFGQTTFLLVGDVEKAAEDDMLKAYANGELDADVLKVAHHGSSSSSTNRFLSAVSPTISAISTAPVSGSSTPHKDVLKRLTNLQSEIRRTDRDGTITIISDGRDVDYQ